jgi:hypothetical protein
MPSDPSASRWPGHARRQTTLPCRWRSHYCAARRLPEWGSEPYELVSEPCEIGSHERTEGVASSKDLVARFYAVVDPAAHLVTYSRAGHLPALRRDGEGLVCLLEEALSPPLGFEDCERTHASAALQPGSQLVLYTDGLVERRSEDLFLSLRRLVQRCGDPDVRPGELGEHLLRSSLPASEKYRDDVAILTAYLPF